MILKWLQKKLPTVRILARKRKDRGPELLKIGDHPENSIIDVIFVHGLWGDPYTTWEAGTADGWPNWLSADIEGARIWTVRWNASPSTIAHQNTLSLSETAAHLLHQFASAGIGGRPVVFITHSLGGLLTKIILRDAVTLNQQTHQRFARAVRCIFFIGTPHSGSTWAKYLLAYYGPLATDRIRILLKNSPDAESLDRWYSANSAQLGIDTYTLYEKRRTHGIIDIVANDSAVTGSEGTLPVPVDVDHIQICKLPSRSDPVYLMIAAKLRAAARTTGALPRRLSGAIASFRESYLFGRSTEGSGRSSEATKLNRWLECANSSILLIVGPAGMGKSHFLTNWTGTQNLWRIAFFPISARFGTNEPAIFYRGIAHVLAACNNEILDEPTFDPAVFFKDTIFRLIHDWDGPPTVLVIDGLDEARWPEFDPSIIPPKLPPNVKLIFSARLQAGDDKFSGWSRRLNLESRVNVAYLEIGPLAKRELSSALIDLGVPETSLSPAILDELYRLTSGDPLLLRLYANELIANSSIGSFAEGLKLIQPGLNAYFRRWIDSISSTETGADRERIDAALAILACAHGPLEAEGFLHLVNAAHKIGALSATSLLAPIQRFVIGDGSPVRGYVLSHPRFREYLRSEYFIGDAIQRTLSGFVDWGNSMILGYDGKTLLPDYLAANFIAHLRDVQAGPEDYGRLMSRDWFDMLDASGRGFDGMSETVNAFLAAAPATRNAPAKFMVLRLRAALCLSSLKSIGSNVPSELAVMALEHGVISQRQFLDIVKLQPDENQIGFLEIGIHLLDDPSLFDIAVSKASSAPDPANRVDHLGRLIDRAPAEQRGRVLELLSEAVEDVVEPNQRARVLLETAQRGGGADVAAINEAAELTEHLNPENQIPMIIKLLNAYRALRSEEYDRWNSRLDAMLAAFPAGTIAAVLPQLVTGLPYRDWRQSARSILAPLKAAFESAKAARVEAHSYTEEMRLRVAADRLAAAMMVGSDPGEEMKTFYMIDKLLGSELDDYWRNDILSKIIRLVPLDIRDKCISSCAELVRSLDTANNRTHALLALSKLSSVSRRTELVRAAWDDARIIDDAPTKRAGIAELLGSVRSRRIVDSEISKLLAEPGRWYAGSQSELLSSLAPQSSSPDSFFDLAVQIGMKVRPQEQRNNLFVRQIKKYPAHYQKSIFIWLLGDILRSAGIHWSFEVAFLAENAPDVWTIEDLDLVLDHGKNLKGFEKAYFLAGLSAVAGRLPHADFYKSALSLAPTFSPEDRSHLLLSLAKNHANRQHELAAAALLAADEIAEELRRCREVLAVLPYLSPDIQKARIPAAALVIDNLPWSQQLEMRLALADLLDEPSRKVEHAKCMKIAGDLAGNARFTGFMNLALKLTDMDDRLDALDSALSTPVTRSSVFHRFSEQGALLHDLGGDALLQSAIDEYKQVSSWWS